MDINLRRHLLSRPSCAHLPSERTLAAEVNCKLHHHPTSAPLASAWLQGRTALGLLRHGPQQRRHGQCSTKTPLKTLNACQAHLQPEARSPFYLHCQHPPLRAQRIGYPLAKILFEHSIGTSASLKPCEEDDRPTDTSRATICTIADISARGNP
ncbi:hypothetical protein BCV69DRAFT_96688 [Microstroma glucosiphilum]|uniref:Uncharacterized protein n=1 Tax=Pseudomicrostroma glucosiphilum TaxID=1684307 RepID=A0A316UHU5_9BASI|nr:hypothetical protein BCV69DRAFT_96688 [Pseudomicrostroma glucosiphilum]PWN22765.1 hypothetical protein BCV69DRAFT_96688 [Pseudomicrostroma glucosiphilum]